MFSPYPSGRQLCANCFYHRKGWGGSPLTKQSKPKLATVKEIKSALKLLKSEKALPSWERNAGSNWWQSKLNVSELNPVTKEMRRKKRVIKRKVKPMIEAVPIVPKPARMIRIKHEEN